MGNKVCVVFIRAMHCFYLIFMDDYNEHDASFIITLSLCTLTASLRQAVFKINFSR